MIAPRRPSSSSSGSGRRSTAPPRPASVETHVRPSVAGIRHELLEHRERRGLAHAGVLQPAREPRHVAEGGSGGEKAGDLEIRVEAGLGPAQRLEHEIAHHDGGVALLAGEPPRRPARPDRAGRPSPRWAGKRSGRDGRRPSGRRRWRRGRGGRIAGRGGRPPPPPRRRGRAWPPARPRPTRWPGRSTGHRPPRRAGARAARPGRGRPSRARPPPRCRGSWPRTSAGGSGSA